MCAEAWVVNGSDERWCGNQKELRDALGLDKLPVHSADYGDSGIGDNYCLCPIDVKEAARLAGYSVDYDFMDYRLIKR